MRTILKNVVFFWGGGFAYNTDEKLNLAANTVYISLCEIEHLSTQLLAFLKLGCSFLIDFKEFFLCQINYIIYAADNLPVCL